METLYNNIEPIEHAITREIVVEVRLKDIVIQL